MEEEEKLDGKESRDHERMRKAINFLSLQKGLATFRLKWNAFGSFKADYVTVLHISE
jgi:hypothetical protein